MLQQIVSHARPSHSDRVALPARAQRAGHGRRCTGVSADSCPSPAPALGGSRRERMPWSDPIALLLRAGIAYLEDDMPLALELLTEAVDRFDRADMKLYAAVARRRLGALQGDAPRAPFRGGPKSGWTRSTSEPRGDDPHARPRFSRPSVTRLSSEPKA